jgi:hypothetical protein
MTAVLLPPQSDGKGFVYIIDGLIEIKNAAYLANCKVE